MAHGLLMQKLVSLSPSRGDTVQVNTWVAAAGKNGMCRGYSSGHTILRAYKCLGDDE